MKTIQGYLLFSALAIAGPAFANDAPPSDASIEELSALTHRQELYNGAKARIDAMVSSALKDASQGQVVTPERQAILDQMNTKMLAAIDEFFNADALQRMHVRIYQATYTQDEVDGMIAFYKTPAGQALVTKGPLLMQNMMDEMQAFMRPLTERIKQIKVDAENEMKALPAQKSQQGTS
jgi:hypothetical protein